MNFFQLGSDMGKLTGMSDNPAEWVLDALQSSELKISG